MGYCHPACQWRVRSEDDDVDADDGQYLVDLIDIHVVTELMADNLHTRSYTWFRSKIKFNSTPSSSPTYIAARQPLVVKSIV
jgi:hypothetical protein